MFSSIFGFMIILAPLVIVHEFGHFFFAKLFGVKAEVFSVGFGPRIFGRRFGETDFRLSIFPLGGYVKLLGEDREAPLSDEDRKRSLHAQAAWKRFFIFFGGPCFNFLYAILVFMVILLIGEPQTGNVIARILPSSAAAKAGLMSGDRILSIDGKSMRRFEEILGAIHDNPNKTLSFEVERTAMGTQPAQRVSVPVTISTEAGFSVYGEQAQVGDLEGLVPLGRDLQIGISNTSSPAGLAGFKTGDKIQALNGVKLKSWEQMEAVYSQLKPGAEAKFDIEQGKSTKSFVFKVIDPTVGIGDATGLHSTELFVDKVVESSPASASGMLSKDRLVSINGTKLTSFFQLKELVQNVGDTTKKAKLVWERDGKLQEVEVTPRGAQSRDPLLNKVTQYTIGVMPMLVLVESEMVIERIYNPLVLLYKGTERVISFSWRNLVSIGKMFTGDVSVATLGGPIMIGKIAGESLTRGLHSFLTTMAILSIGLGVLNILPIPVLDGGHLVLLGLEVVRGKPLSFKQMEIIQQVGLSLILLLMVVVIRNDISRIVTLPSFSSATSTESK